MIKFEELRRALEPTPKLTVATWMEVYQERARNVSDLLCLQNDLGAGLAQEKVFNGDHLQSGGATSLIGTFGSSDHGTRCGQLGEVMIQTASETVLIR